MSIEIPKSYTANLEYRNKLLDAAEADDKFKTVLFHKCKHDILFWFNSFAWINEPRDKVRKKQGLPSQHLPFITYEFQDEIILVIKDHIDRGENLLIEKSRDMGASWIIVSVFLHYWLFDPENNKFHLGSIVEELVDKRGKMGSLFEKLRYQLRRQPSYFMPDGFNWHEHDKYLNLVNPETTGGITGQASTSNFGRSDRQTAVGFDELAFWENDEAAWQSCSDTTNCKIGFSSANGKNNLFYELRSQIDENIKVKRLHWEQHPHKDQEWYKEEKGKRSPANLAQEVDIDYSASVKNKAYPDFNYDKHVTDLDFYRSTQEINLCCDFNIAPMSWCLNQQIKDVTYWFDEISLSERSNTPLAAAMLCRMIEDHTYKVINVYGDASGRSGDTRGNRSDYDIIFQMLQDAGWTVNDYVPTHNGAVSARLNSVAKRLSDFEQDGISHTLINSRCTGFVNSLEQTQIKEETGQIDKKGNIDHMGDAGGYYYVEVFPIEREDNSPSFRAK